MTPDQIDAIRTFARGLPSDGTAPDTAILQLAWDYEDLQSQLAAANERADGLQRIVDEARAQKPVCITTLDDFCTVVAYPPPNVLHSVPLYAAAPVPAQPAAMCGCGDTFGDGSVCANCLAGIDCKPVPYEVPSPTPDMVCHGADELIARCNIGFERGDANTAAVACWYAMYATLYGIGEYAIHQPDAPVAPAIQHSGVVMLDTNECPMCKRYNHAE